MANLPSQVAQYLIIVVGIIVTLMALFGDSYDPILYVSYGLVGLGILLAVGGSLAAMAIRPDRILGSVIGIAILAAVIGIGYGMGSSEIPPSATNLDVTASEVRWSDAELYAIYILGSMALLSIVFSRVMKFVR